MANQLKSLREWINITELKKKYQDEEIFTENKAIYHGPAELRDISIIDDYLANIERNYGKTIIKRN